MNWKVNRYPLYYGNVKQTYPNMAAGEPALSRSVVVGNLILLSGMPGLNLRTGEVASDKLESQMVTALDNVRSAMEEAGSSMNNIIKTTIYLKRLEDYTQMRKTEFAYYQKRRPFEILRTR